jgi:CheY-like chemotaxis protein
MIEIQDGSIEARSTEGEGSTFTIRFPNAVIEMAEESTDGEIAREVPAAALPTRVVDADRAPTILVVEDNPVNRKLARNVLRSRGYDVWEAPSGEEGLRILRERRPDLVLMDIQLPGMDGLEVTRRIKADPDLADLPVVALTAHVREADEQNALDAGCVGYITKPIRLARFPGQIASYLSGTAASAAS